MSKKRLLTEKIYKHLIVDDLIIKQYYKNLTELPKIKKIIINSSSKLVSNEKKYLTPTLLTTELFSGQKLKITRAKKSIAAFKLRKDQVLGAQVLLRKFPKLTFFEKLIKVILPRLEEFDGNNIRSFEKQGNLNLGIENTLFFSESENFFQYFENITGLDINIESSTSKSNEGILLFSLYQLPINYK